MRRSDSSALYERAVSVMPGGNTRTTVFVRPHPPYAASGRGCHIIDVEGRTILDLQNNYTSLVHGHAHPAITAAMVRAMEAGSCFGLPTHNEVELAEELQARMPALEQLRFTNSGTEAVMLAIRTARAVTGRPRVLRFADCYHGSSDVVVGPGTPGVPLGIQRDVITTPFDDHEVAIQILETYGHELACILLDLMPNRAGLRRASPGFVSVLETEARHRGILLIVDEVITFRLARGGLSQSFGLTPDLIVLGKVIGGGLPIGAFGGRAEVMDAFDPRRPDHLAHGGTFNANPLSMVAGAVSLRLLDEEAFRHLEHLGDWLRDGLRSLGYSVAGSGSLARVALGGVDPQELWWRVYDAGVLIATNGLLCASTPMREEDVDRALEAFERVARGPSATSGSPGPP
jgi:glutamate-1-semialdehyde 2,1-aminomutase